MSYYLGLDLGPTSVGWSAIEVDSEGNPCGFLELDNSDPRKETDERAYAIGARVFEAGVDNLSKGQQEEPKNKKRREKRSVRRRLRRARARKLKLINLLREYSFISDSDSELEELQKRDPYEIRARAVNEKISKEEFARILLHFAKRRGFKSNRRQDNKDTERGKVKQAVSRLDKELGDKTLGQFLYEKRRELPFQPIRNRMGEYKWIAQREHYIDELSRIWQKQSQYYPQLLTKEFYDKLNNILFKQIRFELSERKKKKVIGMCSLIKGQPRCPYSERIAQKFRYLQKINDLAVRFSIKEDYRPLSEEEKQKLKEKLSVTKTLKFEQIRKLLWEGSKEQADINLEYKPNDKIKGNEIDAMLTKSPFFDKKKWIQLDEQQKNNVWNILFEFLKEKLSKAQVEEKLEEKYGLGFKKDDWTEKLKEPEGYCKFSKAALKQIVPELENSKNLHEAKKQTGFKKSWSQRRFLPLPSRENGFEITNPIVQSVLFQLRKVVNLLIKEAGLPEKIVIETARDLKAGKERRAEIVKNQSQNQKERDRAADEIRKMHGWDKDVNVSGGDILKYRLWKQQNLFCPYSYRQISQQQLFSDEAQIDHILPYSMSLDNSMNNKVVCFASENQDKGQNTPVSRWKGTEKWEKIQTAIKKKKIISDERKAERFFVENEEISEKYQPERLLRDTSYISRGVREYLKLLYEHNEAEQRVRTTKGVITSQLRNVWGVNAILRDGEVGPKNRDDLRHHAVDAAIIAITSQGMIQRITKQLQRVHPRRPKYADIPEPWEGFGEELAKAVENINVSHRVRRKVKGALHKETNYWKEDSGPHKGKFITRKPLSALTAKMARQICDEKIRKLVQDRIRKFDGKIKNALKEPLHLPNKSGQPIPVKTVRVWKNSDNMLKIKDNIWVEPGSNHHVEIFKGKNKKGEEIQWGRVVSMYEAAQRLKNSKSVIQRETENGDKFINSLSRNEMYMLEFDNGEYKLHRVQKMDSKGSIILRPHTYGGLMKDTDSPPIIQRRSVNTIKGFKVTVDPLGRIRRAGD